MFVFNNLKEAKKEFENIEAGFSKNKDYLKENLSYAITFILDNKDYTDKQKHDLFLLLHGWHVEQFRKNIKEQIKRDVLKFLD